MYFSLAVKSQISKFEKFHFFLLKLPRSLATEPGQLAPPGCGHDTGKTDLANIFLWLLSFPSLWLMNVVSCWDSHIHFLRMSLWCWWSPELTGQCVGPLEAWSVLSNNSLSWSPPACPLYLNLEAWDICANSDNSDNCAPAPGRGCGLWWHWLHYPQHLTLPRQQFIFLISPLATDPVWRLVPGRGREHAV